MTLLSLLRRINVVVPESPIYSSIASKSFYNIVLYRTMSSSTTHGGPGLVSGYLCDKPIITPTNNCSSASSSESPALENQAKSITPNQYVSVEDITFPSKYLPKSAKDGLLGLVSKAFLKGKKDEKRIFFESGQNLNFAPIAAACL